MLHRTIFPILVALQRGVLSLLKAFAELGKEVLIITKSYDNYKFNNKIVKDEHNLNVLRLDHSKWKNKRNILIYKAIKPLINDDTIFIAANWKMAVACYFHSIFRSINYVAVVHGLDAIENRKINKYLQFKAFKNADFVLAVSNFTKNLLLSQFKSSNFKINIINGGVDISKFNINTQSNGIATKYNLKDGFQLMSLARLVKRKGFDFTMSLYQLSMINLFIIILLAQVITKLPFAKLVIELNLQDNVHFIGFIPDDDVATLYSNCDVYSMPSRQLVNDVEGFGLTYLSCCLRYYFDWCV